MYVVFQTKEIQIMDELNILTECALFRGLRRAQIREMLPCLSARQARFRRGQFLLRAGDRASSAGIILSGEAEVLQEDFWGNRNLLAAVGPGELFAEAFACAHAVSPVSVQCTTDGSVLYLNVRAVFSPCEKACAQHKTLSQNLIRVLAEKNMQLNEKAGFLSQRTTREKLLSYLSAQATKSGKNEFDIPFDRQQLADYLCVDRSAMSAQLCALRDEGILKFRKNHFVLNRI
jgi:CRP-like cAMP-binding protein